ncbi:MAG: hypothetical protein GY778_25755 [bacterium]|nr:hypothetical protein [bacterium]
MRVPAMALILGLAVVAVACGAEAEPASEGGAGQATSQESTTTISPSSTSTPEDDYAFDPDEGGDDPVVGEAPPDLIAAILEDLAATTGAAQSAYSVVRAESIVWNDGSLGCSEPGVVYTQATVDGYWVVVDHDGTAYDYRANDSGSFVRCKSGTVPST